MSTHPVFTYVRRPKRPYQSVWPLLMEKWLYLILRQPQSIFPKTKEFVLYNEQKVLSYNDQCLLMGIRSWDNQTLPSWVSGQKLIWTTVKLSGPFSVNENEGPISQVLPISRPHLKNWGEVYQFQRKFYHWTRTLSWMYIYLTSYVSYCLDYTGYNILR